MTPATDVLDLVSDMKAKGEAFALATVVRTVAATAAKAGAKAVIRGDGSVTGGWIGGGCARAAVLKAARDALADGQPRLVSVQPPDLLAEQGVEAGESRAGVRYARNLCPSQGTMDIFVEPVLPRPSLCLFGASPVAVVLARLAAAVGFSVTVAAPSASAAGFPEADRVVAGYSLPPDPQERRFVVVSTQGEGDATALKAALALAAEYRAFVGSRRKMASLREKLAADGVSPEALATVKAPAGLDLGAITPEEIALSILAEITQQRRRGQRPAP